MLKRVFSHLTKSKNPKSPRYRMEMVKRFCGHHVKYVTERVNDVDEVVGRGGGLNIKDDELLVFASSKVLMRSKIADTEAAELLSRDGVVITAPDLLSGGKIRTLVVYFVYYR